MELRTKIGVLSHKVRKKGVGVSLDHRKAEFNDVTNVIVVSPSPSHYFAMNFKGDEPIITKVCADHDSLPAYVEVRKLNGKRETVRDLMDHFKITDDRHDVLNSEWEKIDDYTMPIQNLIIKKDTTASAL
jgi:hypothetical protein